MKGIKILIGYLVKLLLIYSVVFSLVSTTALAVIGWHIYTPLSRVKYLAHKNPPETAFMKSVRRKLIGSNRDSLLLHAFIPLDSVSPHLRKAVIASEDDGFYVHPGIDINAILSAYQYNKSQGSIRRGASTITQQLAKNLFLYEERSFQRKFEELGYTLLLEHYLTKDRIFELYLNYAQWGDNIFGCEAAARYYYNKSSGHLTVDESLHLAAVLAQPEKLTPLSRSSTFVKNRIASMAANLRARGEMSDSILLAIHEPVHSIDSADVDGRDTLQGVAGDTTLDDSAADTLEDIDRPAESIPAEGVQTPGL